MKMTKEDSNRITLLEATIEETYTNIEAEIGRLAAIAKTMDYHSHAGPGQRIQTWSRNLVRTKPILNLFLIQSTIILSNYIFAQNLVRTSPDVRI